MLRSLSFAHNDGFTLAEVLITLVIIGVIAAMTVPTMIAKYQKQVLAVSFKKAYSEISRAIILSQIHNGPLDTWDYPADNTSENVEVFAKKYIIPYLQIAKDCGMEAGKGCFIPHTAHKMITGMDYSQITDDRTNNYKVVLNSGMSLGISFMDVNCVNNKNRCAVFQVDTNGHKKPNQIGRDMFSFSAYPFTNNLMPDGVYDLSQISYDPVTKTWKHTSIAAINENCNPNGGSSSTGWQCAGKIMLEGWQMNY